MKFIITAAIVACLTMCQSAHAVYLGPFPRYDVKPICERYAANKVEETGQPVGYNAFRAECVYAEWTMIKEMRENMTFPESAMRECAAQSSDYVTLIACISGMGYNLQY